MKYWNWFFAMFKVKYVLNRMDFIIFSHQMRWFDGKRVDIHPSSCKDQSSQMT